MQSAINQANPFDQGYFESNELEEFGFKHVGQNVRIAKNCTIVGLSNISLGDHVRIDDGVVIAAHSGHLTLGSFIHIAAGCYLGCAGGIILNDFAGLSHGVRIYSASDDYSGEHLTNPTVPKEFLGVKSGRVELGRHVIVGSGSVLLPNVRIGDGAAVGAMSLVTRPLDEWGIYSGVPAKRIKSRSRRLLDLERQLLAGKPS